MKRRRREGIRVRGAHRRGLKRPGSELREQGTAELGLRLRTEREREDGKGEEEDGTDRSVTGHCEPSDGRWTGRVPPG